MRQPELAAVVLVVVLLLPAQQAACNPTVPHVEECNFCQTCLVDEPEAAVGAPLQHAAPAESIVASQPAPRKLQHQADHAAQAAHSQHGSWPWDPGPNNHHQPDLNTPQGISPNLHQHTRLYHTRHASHTRGLSAIRHKPSLRQSALQQQHPQQQQQLQLLQGRVQPGTSWRSQFTATATQVPSDTTLDAVHQHPQQQQPPQQQQGQAWLQWPRHIPRILQGSQLGPAGRVAQLLTPVTSRRQRAHLPNCTVCRGCNAQLEDMTLPVQRFGPRLRWQHHQGNSASWTFFATPAGTTQRYIVKVFCIPFTKQHAPLEDEDTAPGNAAADMEGQPGTLMSAAAAAATTAAAGAAAGAAGAAAMGAGAAGKARCAANLYEQRVRILLAIQQVMQECGAAQLSPKVWLAPLKAVLPGLGYPVDSWALWQEEAAGITLQGLYMARADSLAVELLSTRLNTTQVVMAAVLDVLTGQCDRHAGNVFITEAGDLQLIDNDKALGALPGCGYDSLLVPGSRYHSYMRAGPRNGLTSWYRRFAGMCHGPVFPHITVDYRCWVPPHNQSHTAGAAGGHATAAAAAAAAANQLHTAYPPALTSCLQQLAGLGVQGIRAHYGLTDKSTAQVLHTRARDLLQHGFEWVLQHGEPRNSPHYQRAPQPACCGLAKERRHLTCSHCWAPDLREELGE